MMSIYDRVKELESTINMQICPVCGRYCTYKIYMNYTCLSLFFIPVLRWGKEYYAQSSCCQRIVSLDRETGKKAERGERIEKEI